MIYKALSSLRVYYILRFNEIKPFNGYTYNHFKLILGQKKQELGYYGYSVLKFHSFNVVFTLFSCSIIMGYFQSGYCVTDILLYICNFI